MADVIDVLQFCYKGGRVGGAVSPTDVARELDMAHARAKRMLERLHSLGWLDQTTAAIGDGRKLRRFRITERGNMVIEHIASPSRIIRF